MRPRKDHIVKDGTPTEKNGLLVISTINGRLPDYGNLTDRVCISDRRNQMTDDVCYLIQRHMYRAMRRETEHGMIIIAEHQMKSTWDHVRYEVQLYLGKPSPNLSAIFKAKVQELDIEQLTNEVEDKWYDKDDDEEDDETTPDGI